MKGENEIMDFYKNNLKEGVFSKEEFNEIRRKTNKLYFNENTTMFNWKLEKDDENE